MEEENEVKEIPKVGDFKFKAGNQYWRVRISPGRAREYTPEQLAEGANEYFEFIEQNPFREQDFRGKDANEVKINRMRPMTIEGLCNALEITTHTFYNYEKIDAYFHITKRIRQIIEAQQFEGAASGFLNANIIARKLGLGDKSELTHNLGATFERELLD